MEVKHTPIPWRYFRTERIGNSGHKHADLFIIESDSRKSMAALEVWELNVDPKWRELHQNAVKERAETLLEVEANATLIVTAVNAHAGLIEMIKDAEVAMNEIMLGMPETKRWADVHDRLRQTTLPPESTK